MSIATATPLFVWYLMRGSGLVALVLITATVALGVVGVTRLKSPRWPQLVTAGLHKNLSLLAATFLAVHIATAVIDQWVGLGWIGLVVPFQSHYRPLWLGLGVLAIDPLIAVIATSLLRRHIPYRAWRLVHWSTWAMWPLAVAHGLGSGTDSHSGIGLGIELACIATVAAAAVWRVVYHRSKSASASSGRTAPSGRHVPSAATVGGTPGQVTVSVMVPVTAGVPGDRARGGSPHVA